MIHNVQFALCKSFIFYLTQLMGPVRGSPALRAPAYFSIAAPRSDPISHERSALQPYPALHAPPYIDINAPRSDKAQRSTLQYIFPSLLPYDPRAPIKTFPQLYYNVV